MDGDRVPLTGRDFEPISCRERGKPHATCPYGWVLRRLRGIEGMPANVAEWTRTTYRHYPHLPGDGHDDGSQQGRKVVRGADAIGLSANRRDTYRLSYDWWQGVWNVGFRAICEDEDPTLETVASAK